MTKNSHIPKRAILLAAGRGKRLRPYTDVTPKPLLPVNGRPTLDFVLCSLQAAGVTQVALVVHHLADQIRAFVGDGKAWGMTAHFFDQTHMLGTGHAVKTAVSFITDPTFILATDYILPLPFLADLKQAYLENKTEMAVSLKTLTDEEMVGRSSVRFNSQGLITEIVEKPALGKAPSQTGASLIYIVPQTITAYLNQQHTSSRGEFELQDVINQMLAAGSTMCGLIQTAPPEWEKPSEFNPKKKKGGIFGNYENPQ